MMGRLPIYQEPGLWRQVFCSLLGSVGGVNLGCYMAYVAVALPSFEADPSKPFVMNNREKSLVVGLPCLSAIGGSILSATINAKFGRKIIILVSELPVVISWILFAFGNSIHFFLASSVMQGFFIGIVLPIGPLYLTEISSPKTRGFITGTTALAVVLYNLVNYCLGAIMGWRELAVTNAAIHVVYIIVGAFVPESPAWLIANGHRGEAEKALKLLGIERLPSLGDPAPEVHQAMLETGQQETTTNEEPENPPPSIREIFEWANFKRFLLICIFVVLRQFTGAYAVVAYTVNIFQSAGGGVNPNVSAIILGVVQVIFVALSNAITDRIGRKHLVVGSGIVTGLAHCVFGLYYFLRSRSEYEQMASTTLSWIPLAALIVFIAGFSIGIAPALYVFLVELIPSRIKDYMSGFIAVVNSLANFAVVSLYYTMKEGLTEAGMFTLYGGSCFVIAIFCALVFPETKGKTLEELNVTFKKKSDKAQVEQTTSEKAK